MRLCASVLFFLANGLIATASEPDSEIGAALAAKIDSVSQAFPSQDTLRTFYAARNFAPLWISDNQEYSRAALATVEELKNAGDWGLDEAGYHVAPPQTANAEGLADAELRLSSAILTYVNAAQGGRIVSPPTQLSSYLDRKPSLADPITVLNGIAASSRPDLFLLSFHPQHREFRRLQKALQAERAERGASGSVKLPKSGPDLRLGTAHHDVVLLRQRLGVGEGEIFDRTLARAVEDFQRKRGLSPIDGMVGPKTRDALNAVNVSRIETLKANMEQWRWMPANLGADHIIVNIPSFQASFIQGGRAIFEERVVVGKRESQTPIFSADLRTIVLHPRWRVPETIMLRELLPGLIAGRTLEGRGFQLWRNGKRINSATVNWRKADLRAYEIYQASGDDNALGNVKFLFPNKHSVYLHDTPAKHLFETRERAFSHGCVRLRNPLHLAQLLLGQDKELSPERVAALMDSGPLDNAINLEKRIPVHLTYFTARAEEDGTVRLLPDIYGHEKRVTLALAGKWSEIDKGSDHLKPVDAREISAITAGAFGDAKFRRATRTFSAPMGLFGNAGLGTQSGGTTANDIFRRSFGN